MGTLWKPTVTLDSLAFLSIIVEERVSLYIQLDLRDPLQIS